VTLHALPIEPTVVQRMKDLLVAGRALTPQQTVELDAGDLPRLRQRQRRRALPPCSSICWPAMRRWCFHCTAGKDRTGFAAALILLALGVPRPVVMQDYLLTNELLRMDSARPTAFRPR
jgi:protein-tyrosine phosphatase